MKVTVKEEFDLFELFVHDTEAIHALCPYEVAEAINEHLCESGWKVSPPESLSRFTLFSIDDEEEGYLERYYTAQQVKDAFPPEVVEALEEINELEFDLSPRKQS